MLICLYALLLLVSSYNCQTIGARVTIDSPYTSNNLFACSPDASSFAVLKLYRSICYIYVYQKSTTTNQYKQIDTLTASVPFSSYLLKLSISNNLRIALITKQYFKIFDYDQGTYQQILNKQMSTIYAGDFTESGQLIVVSTYQKLLVYNVNEQAQKQSIDFQNGDGCDTMKTVKLSNQFLLASGPDQCPVLVYQLKNGEQQFSLYYTHNILFSFQQKHKPLDISPDGKILAVGLGPTAYSYENEFISHIRDCQDESNQQVVQIEALSDYGFAFKCSQQYIFFILKYRQEQEGFHKFFLNTRIRGEKYFDVSKDGQKLFALTINQVTIYNLNQNYDQDITFDTSNVLLIVLLATLIPVIVCICFPLVIFIIFAGCCKRNQLDRQLDPQELQNYFNSYEAQNYLNTQKIQNQQLSSQRLKKSVVQYENQKQKLFVCTICLEHSSDCQTFCRHKFHKKCIDAWMIKNQSCPQCRKILKKDDLKLIIYGD